MTNFKATHIITTDAGVRHEVMNTVAGYQNVFECNDGVAPALVELQDGLYCDGVKVECGYNIRTAA